MGSWRGIRRFGRRIWEGACRGRGSGSGSESGPGSGSGPESVSVSGPVSASVSGSGSGSGVGVGGRGRGPGSGVGSQWAPGRSGAAKRRCSILEHHPHDVVRSTIAEGMQGEARDRRFRGGRETPRDRLNQGFVIEDHEPCFSGWLDGLPDGAGALNGASGAASPAGPSPPSRGGGSQSASVSRSQSDGG